MASNILSMLNKLLIIVASLSCFASPGFSSTEHKLSKISFVGLDRTKPFVVLRELGFHEGDKVTSSAIEKGVQRIRNLRIFSTVTYQLKNNLDATELVISLQERWTTIPIAKFGSGGGVNQLILGAYDVNLGGRYLEAGAQYERFGDENSGVAWFRNPRLFNQDLELFVSYWDIRRAKFLYEADSSDIANKRSFILHRQKVSAQIEKQFSEKIRLGLSLESNDDRFSEQQQSDSSLSIAGIDPAQETSSKMLLFGVLAKLGQLNYNNYLVDGTRLDLKLEHADKSLESTSQLTRSTTSLLWFKTVASDNTLAARAMLGAADTSNVQHYYYLGGLDRLRGFVDSRFFSKNFYLLNIEYRIPTYKTNWLVVQNTFFTDVAGISNQFDQNLLDAHAASLGAGLRIISPKIYRLTLRIDYARSILNQGHAPVSFGVQQFF